MLSTVTKTLENLGLNKHESSVLTFLLENGPLKVSNISQGTKLNRTTLYGILKSLTSKGLASSVEKRGVLYYQSIAPNLLLEYIERRREELNKNKTDLNSFLPQLIRLREKSPNLPKIQFFEGVEGVKQAYEDTLENNRERILYAITGMDVIYETMDKAWIEYYLKKRKKLGIKCFDITLDTSPGRAAKAADAELIRITKLLPIQYSFKTEINIYDDKVAIFSFSNEIVGVLIQDKNIADTMKMLFQFVSNTLK